MKESNKNFFIKITFLAISVFLGIMFVYWTIYPNLQIRSLHINYRKMITNAESSYIIDNPSLFYYNAYQSRLRYLLLTLVINAYRDKIITTESKILPFSIKKLEESLNWNKPYLNNYLYLGKAYDTMALLNKDKDSQTMKYYFNRGVEYYKKALEIAPTQQTVIVSYAINLYNQREYDKSIELLKNSIKIDKDIPELHYYLGQFLFNREKDKKEAEQALIELEISLNAGYNPDEFLTKQTYQRLMIYFANNNDKTRIFIVINRLKEINKEQLQLYNKLFDYIVKNNSIPLIELENNI